MVIFFMSAKDIASRIFYVSIFIVAVGCVIGYVFVSHARQLIDARHSGMRSVILGINMYDSFHEHLPHDYIIDTKPVNSWRFQMLSFVTSVTGNEAHFDRPWNDPSNAIWHAIPINAYCWRKSTSTNVMGVSGKDCAFDSDEELRLSDLPGDCIVLVEVFDRGVHWMEPGDVVMAEIKALDNNGRDFFVAFADGEVWQISGKIPFSEMRQFFTRSGAQSVERADILGKYRLTH